jgi:hypothetical protein
MIQQFSKNPLLSLTSLETQLQKVFLIEVIKKIIGYCCQNLLLDGAMCECCCILEHLLRENYSQLNTLQGSQHRDRTRTRTLFVFSSFEHAKNLLIMGPNNTKLIIKV